MLAICICKISFSYTKRLAFSLFYKKNFNSNGYILKIKGIYLKNMLIVNSQGCALRKIEGLDNPVFWNCKMQGVQRMLFIKIKKKNYSSLISQEQKEGARGHQVLLRARLCQWIAWHQCKNLIIGNVTLSLPGMTKKEFFLTIEIYITMLSNRR